jgi:hypothetical protein
MDKNLQQITQEILAVPGWTLTSIGDELGLSAQSIMRYRNGVEPRYSDAVKLIDIHKRLFRGNKPASTKDAVK